MLVQQTWVRKSSSVFLALAVVMPIALALLPVQKVYAATGSWVDAATIEVEGTQYTDPDIGDSMDYFVGGVDDCTSVVKGFDGNFDENFRANDDFNEARFERKQRNTVTGSCENLGTEDITLSNVGNARLVAYWVDAGTIELISGFRISNTGLPFGSNNFNNARIYKAVEGRENTFSMEAESDCKSSMEVSGDSAATWVVRFGGCGEDEGIPINIVLGGLDNRALAAGTGASGGEGGGAIEPSCEFNLTDALSWIGCQVLNSANKAIRRIDVALSQELAFQENDRGLSQFTLDANALRDFDRSQSPGKEYYQIWSVFRFIATSLIIIAALLMIVGQAASFGPFDAYTVKKLMPKILAAVVFVNLSWQLCVLAIQAVNGIGFGVRALMYAPFESSGVSIDQFFNVSAFEGLASGGLVVGGFAVASSLGIMGLLSLAISALLALAVGFVIVILRKVLITLLVVMAPLAIASMVLPNTDKLWKFWKDSFTKGLMMFPIIMALLASGRIFSYMTVVGESGGTLATSAGAAQGPGGIIGDGKGLIVQLVAIIAYFVPYFLIPATFKFAGGAMSTLTGKLNDKSKGLADRNKNWRGNIKKARKENAAYNNYANRDSDGFRGRKARMALRGQAIGAGHSPLQKGDWNRTKAAQAAQGLKVQQDAFQQELTASKLEDDDNLNSQLSALSRGESVTTANGTRIASTRAARQWAMDQIGKKGLAAEARQVEAHYGDGGAGAGDSEGAGFWRNAKQSNFGNIRDKAPDLVGNSDLSSLSAESVAGWHTSTLQNWQQQFETSKAGALSGDATAEAQYKRMLAQMKSINENDKLKASMGPEALSIVMGRGFTKPDGTGHAENGSVKADFDNIGAVDWNDIR